MIHEVRPEFCFVRGGKYGKRIRTQCPLEPPSLYVALHRHYPILGLLPVNGNLAPSLFPGKRNGGLDDYLNPTAYE